MMVMMVTMLVRVLSLMAFLIIKQVALDLFIFDLFLCVLVTVAVPMAMTVAVTVAMMMFVCMVAMVMVVFVLTTKMVVSIT